MLNLLEKRYALVTEYADSGTLLAYFRRNFGKLTWSYKYSLAYQLSSVVLYLHDEKIIHRDLVTIYVIYNLPSCYVDFPYYEFH